MNNNDIIATTIRQRLAELASTKLLERKKGIDGLKDYLGYDDQAVTFLNESSSVKSSSMKWDNIFTNVTDCLILSCEGGARAKKTSKDIIVAAEGLIWTIISKANTPSCIYVPSAKLLGFVFEVWETPQLKEELETFCCSLIISELLEKEIYWSKMGGDKWNALVQLAFDLHQDNPQDRKKTEICLTILLLVLRHGTSYSNIALSLKKKIFTFIVKLLQDTRDLADNDFLQNNLVSQLIFLSTELGAECKAALCKAGELLLPRLIRLIYEQQKTGPTLPIVSQLYKALLLQYNAHHPLGIDSKESAFSGDAHKWKDILKRVYYMIDREIARLQRSKVTQCSEDFVHLTVHLVAWFYHESKEESALGDITLDTSVSAKRVKLTVFNIEYFIELLRESSNPYDIWPVLHLVACLVFRFPKLITPGEYKTLLQMFSEYQCNNFTNNETIMNYLYEGFFSFFLALKHITFPDDETRTSVHKIWKNIFLKLIGSNQCIRSCHLLLRYLLSYRPDLCQTEQLMKSYTDKVVSLNEDSLKTLFYLISKVQTSTENRLELVDWLLYGMESLVLNDRELADYVCPATLFMLCSNTKPNTLECHPSELNHLFEFLHPSSLEYLYAASNFDQGLFTGRRKDVTAEGAHETYDFINGKQIIFNTPVLNRMTECFKRLVYTITNKLSTEVLDVDSVKFILINLSFWICFGKYIDYLPTQSKLKANLIKCMPEILDKVLSKLSYLSLISTELYFTFLNMLHNINQAHISVTTVLLPAENDSMITTYISAVSVNQLPSGNILETVMPINTYPKEIRDLNFHKLSLTFSDKQLKIFRYVVLLIQYSCNDSGLVDDQKLVISKLFETTDQYLLYGFKNMHLLTSAYLINNVARIKDVDLVSMESCIVTFLELCKTWQRQSDVIEHILLPLLKLFFCKVQHKYEIFRNELVNYLTKFYILMNKGFFSASLQTELVKSFGLLAEIDPQIEWALSSENCLQIKNELQMETQPLILEMLAFVRSPFHSVRMAAIKYLTFIFQTSTLKRLKDWMDEDAMFKLLTHSLEKILQLDDDFTESEYVDEAVNRTASFLHAIACIISTCPCFSRQALNYSFLMFFKKKLNLSLFKKLLSLILKNMNISTKQLLNENMFYTLTSWYKAFQTFQFFPFLLFYSDSKNFFKANAVNIVTILYLNGNSDEMNYYAQLVSMDVPSLLKGAMPKILALGEEGIVSSEMLPPNILKTRMDEIVLNLLCNVTDYKHFNITACVPAPCIIHINFSQLNVHLDMLKHKLDLDVSPIEYLCENDPSSIQRLHLNLSRYIYEARSFEFKIEAIHRYAIFLQLLKPVFNAPENLILDFLVHSVVYTLLHTLSSLECSGIILTCLEHFLHDILPQCSLILIPLLPGLIKSLIPITQMESDLKSKSLCIIEFLVVRHSNELSEGISALDPFPHSEEYERISKVYNNYRGYQPRTSLHKEISHFVTAGISNLKCKITECCRLEGLNNINYLLTHQRGHLNSFMVSSLSDCEQETLEKMLNRLVVVLSKLATSPDEKISTNAVVCLGKIGPYCMNPTTALTTAPVIKNSADLMLTQVIASNLILYLGDDNINVVSIASEALINLLDTPEGYAIINKLTPLERKLIYPMLPSTKKSKVDLQNLFDESKFKALVGVTNRWVPLTSVSHEQWISNLTATIINSFETSKCYLRYLIELCTLKTDFAEKILCYLIYFILRIKSRSKEAETIISARMRHFFSTHQKAVRSPDNISTETEIHLNKKSVKCLLDVVHFVRNNQDTPNGILLHLDYLHVAQAAMFCSAPYSAILFSHFSSEQLLSTLADRYSTNESLSPMDYICNQKPVDGSYLQDILREAYTQINDIDSVHGVGNSKLTHMSSRINHYKITSNWQRVLECSDSLMSAQGAEQSTAKQDMKQSLAHCGLYFIQTQLSEGRDFDACWRLSQWDYPDNECNENSFAMYHYKALKCLHKGETVLCVENINAARKSLVHLLNLTDMEYTKQVQPVLSKLRMLQEIEEYVDSKSCRESDIITKWEDNQFIGNVEFKLVEPILSQRSVLLKESKLDREYTVPFHLKIAQKARIENHFHIAERILYSVDQMSLSKTEKFRVQFEQAQLFWDRNEREVAKFSLRNILPNMEDEPNRELIYFKALRTYGCWQAATNSENLRFIMQKYFEPALKALPKDEVEERLKTYDCLAKYADEKHVQISESLTNIQRFFDSSSKSALELRQQALDTRETETRQKDRKLYLLMAMEYYIKSLAEGNLNDIKIFRLVSLWLDNTDEADLLHMLIESIMRIPSYKFVKVLPQLVGRISNLQTKENMLMLQVIEKCALDHPHHTLPLILAVANSLKDEIYLKKEPANNATMDARIKGAEYLLMKLKKPDVHGKKNLLEIIRQQEVLSLAYIILANYFVGNAARMSAKVHTIPSSQQLVKIKDFDQICVSTMTLKLNPGGEYNTIVGVHKFDRSFSIPGGINEPKRITCIGTDGRKYTQLLKGKDDPRQDAVMQQVFTIMNELLNANKTAGKRNLSVQTYKVVPLSQMSGIIEWCNDSLPIYAYLVGDSREPGAHERYNPRDLPHSKCREKLEALRKTSALTSKKLSEYLSICKKFNPVFRYFFLERCKHPSEWHSMVSNYTRSVATSSMVGYILGLGDRHLNNILISLKTGQVIHIDFGIAFEQGYVLPTPETVPFRLTRDIEDGMGVTGTEGTFKRTCETTLSVLRVNSETILSILEVLLYDPLYTWTLTPTKAAEKQKGTSSMFTPTTVPVNKIAARALFRLKQKLLGIEDGIVLSVEAQVNILILRAKDPEKLCALYPGWQPYL